MPRPPRVAAVHDDAWQRLNERRPVQRCGCWVRNRFQSASIGIEDDVREVIEHLTQFLAGDSVRLGPATAVATASA